LALAEVQWENSCGLRSDAIAKIWSARGPPPARGERFSDSDETLADVGFFDSFGVRLTSLNMTL